MPTAGLVSVTANDLFLQKTDWINYSTPIYPTIPNVPFVSGVVQPSVEMWNDYELARATPVQIIWGVGETNIPTKEDLRESESDDFLDEVYARISSGHVPAAMDAVIDHLDRLLNDGFFKVCNKLLAQADLERMPSNVRRAFLAVTRPAKQELPARIAFFNEALRLLSQERGEETARKILKSLT
jgi:hypothetical protein